MGKFRQEKCLAHSYATNQTKSLCQKQREAHHTFYPNMVAILYNPTADTKVSADASSFGLGACCYPDSNSSWRPVAFS